MESTGTFGGGRFRRSRLGWGLTGILAGLLVLGTAVGVAAADNSSGRTQADVQNQGGGGVYAEQAATLDRSSTSLKVQWHIPTPEPGSYSYPTPDMVPPGAPLHPPIEAGRPEVFTLWAFVFDHPEGCTDPCDFDDLGDTSAHGSVYQLDGTIAHGARISMSNGIDVGDAPIVGLGLENPLGAEVHVAMAPHGKAREGAELKQQLGSSVGTPAHWWAAIFD